MIELECRGVAKRLAGQAVLSDVTLSVGQGSLTAILGASGSGKTTLLRVLMGFARADAGTIRLGDRVVTEAPHVHVPAEARGIGYVAQEGALFPHLTVGRNVGFGLGRQERRLGARIDDALRMVGLGPEYARRQPHELSGGEQRRVALARALAPRPAIVLLDEPFSGLDAALRTETRGAVRGALADAGATAIMVTHDQSEAMSMGREVALLRGGRLVQTGTPTEVYHRPIDLEVARFVGDSVVLEGQASGSVAVSSLGRLALSTAVPSGSVQLMIRPEQIVIGPALPGATGPEAEVTGLEFFGARTLVTLSLDTDEPAALLQSTVVSHSAPALGERVTVSVSGTVVAYPAGASATAEGR